MDSSSVECPHAQMSTEVFERETDDSVTNIWFK